MDSCQQYYYKYFIDTGRLKFNAADCLKVTLDNHVYYYGDQFRCPPDKNHGSIDKLIFQLQRMLRYIYFSLSMTEEADFQSNAYFSFNNELRSLGYSVIKTPWSGRFLKGSFRKIFPLISLIEDKLRYADFSFLISSDMRSLVEDLEAALYEYYKNIRALVVPNDMAFFEGISISCFKKLGKPSFVFLHGLPGRYNNIDDNRADYLIVWGDAIKRNYIKSGVPEGKILVSGHPKYKERPSGKLRSGKENILVLTKSNGGAQASTNRTIIEDRGNSILYLYQVQDALTKIGVKHAVLRPHPSESGEWYMKYLDNRFYALTKVALDDALAKSSLVIGPTSSVMLESFYNGVNYIVYEPSSENTDLMGYELVAPFDGSDGFLEIAKTPEELAHHVKNRVSPDMAKYGEYIMIPFDLSFLKVIV